MTFLPAPPASAGVPAGDVVPPPGGLGAPPDDAPYWSPFVLRHAPMRRLMLVNIADEPRCPGVEPQLFDDEVHGRGAAVLVYRPDRRVDVYHQPGVRLDPAAYAVGAGLHRMIEHPLDGLRFEAGPDGVDLALGFVDADGLRLDVRVRERRRGAMRPVSLLAPIGGDIDRPRALPLFFLHGFTLVPRAGTEVDIRVDGVSRSPLPFPVPIGRHRYWFLRYGTAPFICELNPAHDGPLAAITGRAGSTTADGVRHDLVESPGGPALARLAVAGASGSLTVDFDPAFPDPARIPNGSTVEGRFRVLASGTAGRLGGRWSARRSGRRVDLALRPAGGWRSAERGLLFPLLFRAPPFRAWPDTYRWTAEVELAEAPAADGREPADVAPTMQSRWERVGGDS